MGIQPEVRYSSLVSTSFFMVGRFASEMHLKLNFSKCEVVQFARQRGQVACKVEIDGVEIPSEKEGKCLGYWWQGDLFAKKAVEENVMKARRSFFMYGALIGGLSRRLKPVVHKICNRNVCSPGVIVWV